MSISNREKEPVVFRPKAGYAIPFFVVMAVLTVVSFIIPLRPAQSYSEKRSLAEFPEFSLEAVVSGSYFDDISLWFSDTFPGRESWITLSRELETLHGYSDILIQGDIPVNNPVIQVPDFTMPPATVPPTQPPQPTEATVPPETAEPTMPPTIPIEEWGGLNVDQAVVDIGAVIQTDDFALGYFGFAEETSKWHAGNVNNLAAVLEGKDVNIVSAPPPSAIGIMVENEYMELLNCEPQDAALDYIHSLMDESIIKVDTVRNLIPHNDEYLFFRTDHHWTALAAYYTYEQIMLALNKEPAPLENFAVLDQGEFQGSFYYRCANPGKLTTDNVIAYDPPGELTTMLYNADGSGFPWTVITDMRNSNITAKYMGFLGGDYAMTVITNESLPDAPNCLVVKDSYGNCFVPFVTQNYHKVYAIDYRKYYQMSISKLVEKYDIQDVIMLANLGSIQNVEVSPLLQNLCR